MNSKHSVSSSKQKNQQSGIAFVVTFCVAWCDVVERAMVGCPSETLIQHGYALAEAVYVRRSARQPEQNARLQATGFSLKLNSGFVPSS